MSPLAYTWMRGPARHHRGVIELDGRRAERYEPLAYVGEVGIALARVLTPDHAVAFVERFGMLDGPHLLDGDPLPVLVTRPLADFEQSAAELRDILRTITDVRKAVTGDPAALIRLRKSHGPLTSDSRLTIETTESPRRTLRVNEWRRIATTTRDPVLHADIERWTARMTDREVLIRASEWTALVLSNGLLDAHPYVFDPAQMFPGEAHTPGTLTIAILPETLLGFCYLSVAQQLNRRGAGMPDWCPQCGRAFVPKDKRQSFCTPACASQQRWEKFKTSPKYTARKQVSHKGRGRDGKTTRKG